GTQWLQYLSVRRLLALSDKDVYAGRRFLPAIAIAGVILSWIHFGCTFLDTAVIKYQLTDAKFQFHSTTLICMIFTQTIFPADYLYAFTASGCWLELIMRYIDSGFFQFGQPRLHHSPHVAHHLEHGIGPRSALFAPAMAFVQRKDEDSPRSGSSSHSANTAAEESNTSSL
uniref:Fatty acid hydroxylase domain-containing protein n=1 Tax=Plectus sambesii TaxID=2011161 RepID=A0A914UQT8_9BILA